MLSLTKHESNTQKKKKKNDKENLVRDCSFVRRYIALMNSSFAFLCANQSMNQQTESKAQQTKKKKILKPFNTRVRLRGDKLARSLSSTSTANSSISISIDQFTFAYRRQVNDLRAGRSELAVFFARNLASPDNAAPKNKIEKNNSLSCCFRIFNVN